MIELDGDRIRFSHPLLASAAYAEAAADHRRESIAVSPWSSQNLRSARRYLALASERPDPEIAATLDEAAIRAASRGGAGGGCRACRARCEVDTLPVNRGKVAALDRRC